MYSIIFGDSSEEVCNLTAFLDIATAGRHRRLITNYIEHKMFHQWKLERDVDLQNTHAVLLKSPRDMMQISSFYAHLGLRSGLVDLYTDTTSVPHGHLLIELSPRTEDQLYYSAKPGPVLQHFIFPDS